MLQYVLIFPIAFLVIKIQYFIFTLLHFQLYGVLSHCRAAFCAFICLHSFPAQTHQHYCKEHHFVCFHGWKVNRHPMQWTNIKSQAYVFKQPAFLDYIFLFFLKPCFYNLWFDYAVCKAFCIPFCCTEGSYNVVHQHRNINANSCNGICIPSQGMLPSTAVGPFSSAPRKVEGGQRAAKISGCYLYIFPTE